MLDPSEKKFTVLFSLIVIAELICSADTALTYAHYLLKPAIVLSLLVFFLWKGKQLSKPVTFLMVLALFFSILGDLLLMFVERSPNFFLMGLVAFLMAHLMYIVLFLKHRNKALVPVGFMVLLLLYAAGLFYILKDSLGTMLVPVIIYMVVILSMATAAYLRAGQVSRLSYGLVLLGAVLFMVSDSLLALNKFYRPLAYSNVSIMLTYAAAQYFIVLGVLKHRERLR